MSDHEQETGTNEPQEQGHDQDVLEQQEHKGYGEDEGEREQALGDE